MKIVQI